MTYSIDAIPTYFNCIVYNYLNGKTSFFFTVVFRTDLQQPEFDIGMQEQRRVRDQQEEQDVLQGVQAAQMPVGGHV